MNQIRCVEKVKKHNDKLVIFYSDWCPYSKDAVKLSRQSGVKHRHYKIDNVPGGFPAILEIFNKRSNETGYDKNHKTKPIVFYKGKFVGGYTELSKIINV